MERCHLTYIEQGDPASLEELGAKLRGCCETKTYSAYIEACIHGLLKVLYIRQNVDIIPVSSFNVIAVVVFTS